ncbi:three component ABC system middle component [Nocardiopsis dassonvillei]|uniref:three component ABC system middle component n=1 Tax=Nocardiopsis dassonvillei TaxID=2014 RepID=UPI003556B0AF
MADWQERPQAGAAYLNPVLLAAIQASAARAYEAERQGRAMVWPLSFVVAPLVLHRPTRIALPSSTRTHLPKWVTDHPVLVAGLPSRSKSLIPVVREGLRLGLRHNLLTLENGRVRAVQSREPRTQGELKELLRSSALVGRWTAKSENPSTVFALLGMRP